MQHSILDTNREIVLSDYQSATLKNKELFVNVSDYTFRGNFLQQI